MIAQPQQEEIVSIAGVCGGDPCIRGTRLPVWAIQRRRLKNQEIGDILAAFPFLSKEDVLAAFRYADSHKEDIERQIQENEV